MSLFDQLRNAAARLMGERPTNSDGRRGTPMHDYAGRWFTTFGPMQLTQDGDAVEGSYDYRGTPCTLEGRIEDGRLVFRYREPTAEGEGWFRQKRHGKFVGQWRPLGEERWSPWEGERPFEGIWDSSFGPLRLVQEPDRVIGFYEGLGPSTVEGQLDGNRLTFRYQEPKARGEGHFDLAPDGESFQGEWRPDGATSWAPWAGRRVHPMPGYCWLVIIEAHWQRTLAERDFSFGDMLRAFFARLPHVGVRQRFFDNAEGLERWLRDLRYLPEPTAVLISAHANEEGISAHGVPFQPAGLIDSLRYADDVFLLHFSSCLMMQEGRAGDLGRALRQEVDFPISGYTTSVDWAASALLEFHYLDLVLGRGYPPEEAARQVTRMLSYAGDQAPEGSAYPAAGFRMYLPNGEG